MEETRPKALIYSDFFKEAVALVEARKQGTEHAIGACLHIEGEGIGSKGSSASMHYETTALSSPATPAACETQDREDIAWLNFTGGTTGLPEGAMISHRQICWNVLNTVIHDLAHDDIYLCVFPLFHAGGLFAYMPSQVVFGNTSVLTMRFDPAQVLELIEREHVTVFAAVPTMYQMMTQAPNWDAADLSSLRFCTSGGGPLPVPLVEKYAREKGVRFKQGFGMTEFGPGLFALPAEDAVRRAGSIGRPNFFVDVRVVDDDNRPLGANEVGELVLKGPSGCSGYYNNPEATAAVVDDEGWFHTGDMVYCDDEWYFYVVDRKKDMFVSGGENVYPAEIEAVLYRHSAVHMCAVVGVPDEKWGEVGMASVVLKQDMTLAEEELLAFMRGQLARYKVPKSVEFIAELPISGAGKILKRELRDQFVVKGGRAQAGSPMDPRVV